MISLAAALDAAVARMEAAGIEDARLDAKYLMAHVVEREAMGLSLYGEEQLATDQLITFNDLVDRRLDREPVSKILERRGFYGLDLIVSHGTLDPRADSETLIDLALSHTPERDDFSVLDLGTGTGCLLLAYLTQRPGAIGMGVDLSMEAMLVAQENAQALSLNDRAAFAQGSWIEPIAPGKTFDLILSNPPYIRDDEYEGLQPEVQRFDPPLALFAGRDGLAAYAQILACIDAVSHKGTLLCLELGQGQGPDVIALGQQHGWRLHDRKNDLAGIERALIFGRE